MKLYASFLLLSFCLAGCTIAPQQVTSDSVAVVDGHQDAGIISFSYDESGAIKGAYVRLGYVTEYRRMIKAQGLLIQPPVTSPRPILSAGNDLYYVDATVLSQYAQLVGLEINSP